MLSFNRRSNNYLWLHRRCLFFDELSPFDCDFFAALELLQFAAGDATFAILNDARARTLNRDGGGCASSELRGFGRTGALGVQGVLLIQTGDSEGDGGEGCPRRNA